MNFKCGKAFSNLLLNMDLFLRTFLTSSVAISVISFMLAKLSFLMFVIILNEIITSLMNISKIIIIIILNNIVGIFLIILKKNGLKMYTNITPNKPNPKDVVKLTLPFI